MGGELKGLRLVPPACQTTMKHLPYPLNVVNRLLARATERLACLNRDTEVCVCLCHITAVPVRSVHAADNLLMTSSLSVIGGEANSELNFFT